MAVGRPPLHRAAEMTGARRRVAGLLLMLMVLAVVSDAIAPSIGDRVFPWAAGISSWFAAVVLWPSLSAGLRVAALALIALGTAIGLLSGLDWLVFLEQALSRNAGILCMLIAVGFLRLVPIAAGRGPQRRGTAAWRDTLLATAVFGSVINISALLIIADYLRARGGGRAFALESLTRVFTASAAWSPFFAGMAVVIEYVPGATVSALMAASLPYALVAMLFTWAWGRFRRVDETQHFEGFPLALSALMLPLVLAVLVVCAFVLQPALPIVVMIALSALTACFGFLAFAKGAQHAFREMAEHVETGLANGVNELVLFLAAGVLAVGLAALFDSGQVQLPNAPYDWVFASLALAAMLFFAVLGVHPVVSVTGLAPALLALSPPPVLLALTFLFAWSLGTSVSPLSATLLTVQGRYGLAGWRVACANAPFAAALFVVAVASFYVVDVNGIG